MRRAASGDDGGFKMDSFAAYEVLAAAGVGVSALLDGGDAAAGDAFCGDGDGADPTLCGEKAMIRLLGDALMFVFGGVNDAL